MGSNCLNGFPSASTYRTLTPAIVESVRDSKNKPCSQNLGTVAHIGFSEGHGAGDIPSAVLGTGEEESDDSSKYIHAHNPPPFSLGHLEWRCHVDGPLVSGPMVVTALIDNGSPSVLIDEDLVTKLGSQQRRLPAPQQARLAMGDEEVVVTEWVKLRTFSEDQRWTVRVVRAIVTLGLAYPVILGGPFLKSNKIVIDHELDCVTVKDNSYQLLLALQDAPITPVPVPEVVLEEGLAGGVPGVGPANVLLELTECTRGRKDHLDQGSMTETSYVHLAKALDNRLCILAVWDDLSRHEREIWDTGGKGLWKQVGTCQEH